MVMKKSIIAVIAVIILLIVVLNLAFSFTGQVTGYEASVKRVIDGDTIELQNGERVRLLGIDTPEKGQYLYKESTEWLESLIENRQVTLERDITERDKYDRLLRHVYFGNRHVNLELVKIGYAKSLVILPDEKFSVEISEAEAQAIENNLGIWKYAQIPDVFCIGINYFHYNAKGNDNENLDDEFITFRNSCTYPVNLNDWILQDSANNTYIFSNFLLSNKTTVILHTGNGIDNETDLYWRKSRAVWNNNGDTLKMWNKNRDLILDYTY